MATIYHDVDADLGSLADQTIAVVGYGNQGRSQALNLRDSGTRVIVGSIPDASGEQARSDGFDTRPIAEACAQADAILLLVPDEVMPAVYEREVAPGLRPGNLVSFASGYNVAFGLITPPGTVDVVLLAPRMIGPGVRSAYQRGSGFPSFVAVHQDATGTARERMLALAKGIGSTRAGCIEMSMHDEASLDLFTEQAFGPATSQALMAAIETLIDAGYPPEAVLVELYLSGEIAYTFEKIREEGLLGQMDHHSRTSQYGLVTRGAKFAGFAPRLRATMAEVLDDIRSGRFADEWSARQETAGELLERFRAARESLPLAGWERRARRAIGIVEPGTKPGSS